MRFRCLHNEGFYRMVEGVVADRGMEAARLVPAHAICATVDLPLPPAESEETVARDVVTTLSRALAACGSVAFRYDDPLAGATVRRPPAPRSIKHRLLNLAGLGDETFGLVTASDPAVLAALVAYGGWSHAAQAAVAFDPDCDPSPILDALGQAVDWRGRTLPDGARLLFGPGHDGDFAVVAAMNRFWLDRFKAALRLTQS